MSDDAMRKAVRDCVNIWDSEDTGSDIVLEPIDDPCWDALRLALANDSKVQAMVLRAHADILTQGELWHVVCRAVADTIEKGEVKLEVKP